MILNISSKFGIIERGVYSFGLSDYPHIKPLELKNLVAFIMYEKAHGRQTEIVCKDNSMIEILNNVIAHPETVESIPLPEKIGDGNCACGHGVCVTEFVCHATDINATKKILTCGKLLSAVKAYGKTSEELAFSKRNSLWNDPPDFFEHIMFNWGNCIFGDYVVATGSLENNREPNEEDFKKGLFNPGVRFYFKYEDIIRHSSHTFDGYHIIKVKDEILLSDYLYACIVPEHYKNQVENLVLSKLAAKIHYISHNGLGLCGWTKKVYDFIIEL